jgi:hypothetical protein
MFLAFILLLAFLHFLDTAVVKIPSILCHRCCFCNYPDVGFSAVAGIQLLLKSLPSSAVAAMAAVLALTVLLVSAVAGILLSIKSILSSAVAAIAVVLAFMLLSKSLPSSAVVMATISKRRRNEASILTLFSISKPAYSRTCKDRSEANPAYSTPWKDRSEFCLFHKFER